MLKNSYYVNDQPNGNVYRGKLKDLYNNSKDNWYHQFGTMTFNLSHMNSILVASGGGLCLVSSININNKSPKMNIVPFQPPGYQETTFQTCVSAYQITQGANANKIGALLKAYMVTLNINYASPNSLIFIIR